MITEFYVQSGGSNFNAGSTNLNDAYFSFTGGSWTSGSNGNGFFITSGFDPTTTGITSGMFISIYPINSGRTNFVTYITGVNSTGIGVYLPIRGGIIPNSFSAT